MLTLRKSEHRGPTDLGWLKSRHTFSFGGYHDPKHMGVSVLRVINDDVVAPGAGFAPHSHRDMEIISYVKQGVIEHQDSMGNVQRLPAGEFQLMSAGTGVTHSEYNASQSDSLKFLQIWIEPNRRGIQPGYQQKRFEPRPGLHLIAAPDARDGSLLLHQDARLYRALLNDGERAELALDAGRTAYVHVVAGAFYVNGEPLSEGDGAAVQDVASVMLVGIDGESEALVFDLP
ncbi:MAG TPA: pirin family protein [Burkholderiales bacterium]|nr:pirin family protein [Burkholderiales bacterium]